MQRGRARYYINGYLSQNTCETSISLWTGFDAFTEEASQVLRGNLAFFPFKNPPIFRTWMCSIHLHKMSRPAYPHNKLSLNAVVHMVSKTKSHTDVAPYKTPRYLPDNICLICFSKPSSVGTCVRVILSLQINRIITLTFKIQLLLGINTVII